jgi:hypothetical protein
MLLNSVQERRLLLDLSSIKFYRNKDVSENDGITRARAKCDK